MKTNDAATKIKGLLIVQDTREAIREDKRRAQYGKFGESSQIYHPELRPGLCLYHAMQSVSHL